MSSDSSYINVVSCGSEPRASARADVRLGNGAFSGCGASFRDSISHPADPRGLPTCRDCVAPAARLAMVLFGCSIFVGLVGCSKGHDETTSRPGVVETGFEGPVTITLSATPSELDLDEPLQLVLTVVAPQGVTVDAPYYGSVLRDSEAAIDFRIVSFQERLARPTKDGQLQWDYKFRLAFILPGEYELPGASVSFVAPLESTETSSPNDGRAIASRRTVETSSLAITVRADKAPQLTPEELATIEVPSPVELSEPWGRWWWGVPVVLLGAVVVIALVRIFFPRLYRVLARWLRREQKKAPPVPAHEWARAELARLAMDDLIAQGQVKVFYYRVSSILRGYLERRFHLSAPEMTTEEFLVASATGTLFEPATRAELQRFLEACDLVKYAHFSPDPDEPGRLVGTVVNFVDRTCVNESEADGQDEMVTMREGQAA